MEMVFWISRSPIRCPTMFQFCSAMVTALFSAFNFGVGGGPFDIAAGDFNGDGRFDLAVVNNSSNNVSILVNVGNQSVPADEDPGIQALIFFARSVEFGVGFSPQAVIADDFNLDGKLDLVTIDRLSNTVSVLVNTTVLP